MTQDTSGAPSPGSKRRAGAGVDLYWLPLGAGGHFVRLNGRALRSDPGAPRAPRTSRPLPHRPGDNRARGTLCDRERIGLSATQTERREASGSKDRSAVATWLGSASSATRSAAGGWRSSRISPKQSQAPSASATTRDARVASSSSSRAFPLSCGDAAHSTPTRCGTPTRSSHGSWRKAVCGRKRFTPPLAAGPPDGRPASDRQPELIRVKGTPMVGAERLLVAVATFARPN